MKPMTQPDFRARVEELVELLDSEWFGLSYQPPALDRARAALATPPPEPPTDEELDDFIMFWWGSNAEEQTITDAIECGLMAAFARDILPKLKQQ
jgi:hypothetical protein